jgi:hypothetical protein
MKNHSPLESVPLTFWVKAARHLIVAALLLGMGALQARQARSVQVPRAHPGDQVSRGGAEKSTEGSQQGNNPGIKLNLNIHDLMPDMLLAAPQPAIPEPGQGQTSPLGRRPLMLGQQAGDAGDSTSLMPLISRESRRYNKAPVEETMPELDQPTVDDDQPTVGLHMKVDF